jgi:DNA-directed RNA polymerase beta subunit
MASEDHRPNRSSHQATHQGKSMTSLSNLPAIQIGNLTQGRKRGGGIRFGEMERDALIAHGTAFLLQDRLMNCSDYSTCWVCRTCGSIISLGYEDSSSLTQVDLLASNLLGKGNSRGPGGEYCRICKKESRRGDMDIVAVPFVFRYLVGKRIPLRNDRIQE